MWSRPEQAHRLPGAQLPSHEVANDEAKRGSPRCFLLNSRATVPIIRPPNTVVCRLVNEYNPLLGNVANWQHLI